MSGRSTKNVSSSERDTLRPEYRREDLGEGVRGKYYKQYQEGTNVVLLEPDIAAAFPNEAAVNDALRSLLVLAQRATRLTNKDRS